MNDPVAELGAQAVGAARLVAGLPAIGVDALGLAVLEQEVGLIPVLVALVVGGAADLVEILVTTRWAWRLVMFWLAPVSRNFTGTGRPILNTELPSARIGLMKKLPSADAWYWTQTTNETLFGFPLVSAVWHVTVV